jgi:hypothetical protein
MQVEKDEIAACLMRLKIAVIAEKQQPSITTTCFFQADTLLGSTSPNISAIENLKTNSPLDSWIL